MTIDHSTDMIIAHPDTLHTRLYKILQKIVLILWTVCKIVGKLMSVESKNICQRFNLSQRRPDYP
jgi:hypothetical protein